MRLFALLAALVSCAPAARRVPPVRAPVAAVDDAGVWLDLETMSVDVKTSRVHPLVERKSPDALAEGRLAITVDAHGTTVRDVEQRHAVQTFHEDVRWVGGYLWSSGDLLLSSDERLARIEFTSTDPRYAGSLVWTLPPLAGSRGTALLMGPRDASPNAAAKFVAFAGYEPTGAAPVEIAVVEALARESHRFAVAPRGACSRREVRMIAWAPRQLMIIVACPEGATVARFDF